MNYANMIEEKNLKKTFIVATLCSTLIGTFTASMGLYDRVSEKRKRHRQTQRDHKQDEEIKKLRQDIEGAEQRGKERALQERNRDDVGDNLGMAGAMIQKQFDEGYGRLGRRFAVGDAQTENALQAQIIALQQTVIHVLQDALENSRPLTRADQAKLLAASNAAREGSLDALRQQQLRLDSSASSVSDAPQRALAAPKRASTVVEADPLFCRYSLDLQYMPNKPLGIAFAPGQSCQCPDCGLRLGVASDDFWMISKNKEVIIVENGYEKEAVDTRDFHLGQRFVVKCHTPDGEYACVLCSRYRERDAICRSVEALVNHVGRFHAADELENDVDLWERAPVSRALAPPPVPSPPVLSPPLRGVEVERYR